MQLLLLAVAVLVLGGKSTPTKTPAPQQTTTPATQPNQSTGQIVADVLKTGVELFKELMDAANTKK